MSSSSASRSPSLIACATRLDKILFSCADIRLLLPDPLAPTDYEHTVHDATRRCPVHLDAISQSRGGWLARHLWWSGSWSRGSRLSCHHLESKTRCPWGDGRERRGAPGLLTPPLCTRRVTSG